MIIEHWRLYLTTGDDNQSLKIMMNLSKISSVFQLSVSGWYESSILFYYSTILLCPLNVVLQTCVGNRAKSLLYSVFFSKLHRRINPIALLAIWYFKQNCVLRIYKFWFLSDKFRLRMGKWKFSSTNFHRRILELETRKCVKNSFLKETFCWSNSRRLELIPATPAASL
jgi:hypothetical protein